MPASPSWKRRWIASSRRSARASGSPPSPVRADGTLLEIFTASAERRPERTALKAPDGDYTYAELASAASELAGRLRSEGLGRGDRVVVHVASGTAELYIAILGVLSAGAAYVPIDRDDPPARVADVRPYRDRP